MGTAGSGGRGGRMVPLHWLVLVLAPLAVAQPAPPNCCATKTVGGVDYTFVREDSAALSYSCLSSCVYERNDQPGTAFCFAQGDQQVVCGDSTQGGVTSGPGVTVPNVPSLGARRPTMPGSLRCKYHQPLQVRRSRWWLTFMATEVKGT